MRAIRINSKELQRTGKGKVRSNDKVVKKSGTGIDRCRLYLASASANRFLGKFSLLHGPQSPMSYLRHENYSVYLTGLS